MSQPLPPQPGEEVWGDPDEKRNKPTASSSPAVTRGFLHPWAQGGTSKLLSRRLTVLMGRERQGGAGLPFCPLTAPMLHPNPTNRFLLTPSMGPAQRQQLGGAKHVTMVTQATEAHWTGPIPKKATSHADRTETMYRRAPQILFIPLLHPATSWEQSWVGPALWSTTYALLRQKVGAH